MADGQRPIGAKPRQNLPESKKNEDWYKRNVYYYLGLFNNESIYIANQELIIQNKNTYFPKELIVIDTSNINNLIAKKVDNSIVLVLEDIPIITITPETCEENCKELQDQLIEWAYDNFTSYPGITYYKTNDASRIAFSDANKPYKIVPETDDLLLDISEAINFIDEQYIQNKIDTIPASCQQIIDTATHKSISGSWTEVKITYTEKSKIPGL